MSESNRSVYFTFPILMLESFHGDSEGTITSIMNYCAYDYIIRNGISGTTNEKMKAAESYFNMQYGDRENSFVMGNVIYDAISGANNRPVMTSISGSILWNFYSNQKTDFEVACFLAYAAIRSILQKKAYVKITNDFLLGRMAGDAKPCRGVEFLPEFVHQYSSRWQLDKIKSELQLNWGLVYYAPRTRGYYVSFQSKMDLTTLIYEVEKNRMLKKMAKEEYAKKLEEAKRQAFDRLKETVSASLQH